jgi:hypothetical protein
MMRVPSPLVKGPQAVERGRGEERKRVRKMGLAIGRVTVYHRERLVSTDAVFRRIF